MAKKRWFDVRAEAGSARPEVQIRGIIGDYGQTDTDLIAAIDAMGKVDSLLVRINSIGGDASQALAIFNYLRGLGIEISVRVEGVAMSSGSVIAMAASPGKLVMPANTIMMLHHPWTFTAGNAKELRRTAADLDAWSAAVIECYMARSGMSREELDAFLDEERSITAEEAVALGFADVVEPLARQASARASVARTVMASAIGVPADVLTRIQAIEDEASAAPEGDQEEADSTPGEPVVDEGNTLAVQIADIVQAAGLKEHASVFLLDKSISCAEEARAIVAQAREIRDLCEMAGHPAMARELIQARADRQTACDRITAARAAAADESYLDGHPPGEMSNKPQQDSPSAITTASIWAVHQTGAVRR